MCLFFCFQSSVKRKELQSKSKVSLHEANWGNIWKLSPIDPTGRLLYKECWHEGSLCLSFRCWGNLKNSKLMSEALLRAENTWPSIISSFLLNRITLPSQSRLVTLRVKLSVQQELFVPDIRPRLLSCCFPTELTHSSLSSWLTPLSKHSQASLNMAGSAALVLMSLIFDIKY